MNQSGTDFVVIVEREIPFGSDHSGIIVKERKKEHLYIFFRLYNNVHGYRITARML